MDEVIEFAPKPKAGEPWDVIIIGSGPAALTAAIYTTRGAASTLILAGSSWGGQLMITTNVDNFPGFPQGVQGPDLMLALKRQAQRFGTEFVESDVKQVDFNKKPFELLANSTKYLAKSVIIATGANTKWLEVAGEEKLRGKGISSCAPCDAPFFKDKKVVVIGGGDSAMEEALVLTKYAESVIVIHRRDQLRASAAMKQKVLSNPKIKILWNTEVKEFIGETKLEKVKLLNNKDNTETELIVDGAFIAIGHTPATEIFKGVLDLDEKGYIRRKPETPNSATNIAGVFVAGDVHDYIYRQAITAAGFGCQAAMDTLKFLDKTTPSW